MPSRNLRLFHQNTPESRTGVHLVQGWILWFRAGSLPAWRRIWCGDVYLHYWSNNNTRQYSYLSSSLSLASTQDWYLVGQGYLKGLYLSIGFSIIGRAYPVNKGHAIPKGRLRQKMAGSSPWASIYRSAVGLHWHLSPQVILHHCGSAGVRFLELTTDSRGHTSNSHDAPRIPYSVYDLRFLCASVAELKFTLTGACTKPVNCETTLKWRTLGFWEYVRVIVAISHVF